MNAQASAASSVQDEYDSLPDPFEGVDFDQVPELCGATGDASSDYEEFFDDLDTSELDRVPHLGTPPAAGTADTGSHPQLPLALPPPPNQLAAAAPQSATQRTRDADVSHPDPTVSQAVSTAASTQYMFDDIDETFLQEVSVVEQAAARRLLGNARSNPEPRDASSERRQPSGPVVASARITQRSSFKRKRSDVLSSAPATPSKRQKGNRTKSGDIPETVDPHASARQVLSGIEEELSCPICMEVLATTYITNPCGHSCCGDCLLQWIDTSRKPGPTEHPKCPVCRTQLCRDRPAIRNVAMDSVARRYVSSAEEVGKVDWQPTGDRRRNFLTRSNHSAVLAGQFAQLPNTFPLTVEEDPDFAPPGIPPEMWLEISIEDSDPED